MQNKKTRIKLIFSFEGEFINKDTIIFDKIPDLNELLLKSKLKLINPENNEISIEGERK